MKTIYHFLITGTLTLTAYACNKQLSALPQNEKVDANTIIDAGTAQIALNGAYYNFANATLAKTGWQMHQVAPAQLAGYMGYGYGSFGAEYDNNNDNLSSFYWTESYKLLNSVNGILQAVPGLADNKFTGNRKKEMIAEAHFLRAYAHFKLLIYYAEWFKPESANGVLLRNELSTLGNIIKPRSTVKESYDFIIADLDDAIANGPETNQNVYATKWAAMVLKMRVLMSRGQQSDYTALISLVDNVLQSGPYTLEPVAKDLFRTKGLASEEVILGVTPQANQEKDFYAKSKQYWPGASSLYVATARLKNLLNNDPRQTWVVGSQKGTGLVESYFFTKYIAEGTVPTTVSETDYAIRLSEVYLLKAEAIVRSGGALNDAKELVHQIQEKAGITATQNTTSYLAIENAAAAPELLVEIYKETVKTLVGEDGMEWMALLRLPFATVQQLKPTITNQVLYILPVPADEFKYNPAFGDQNPGYQKL